MAVAVALWWMPLTAWLDLAATGRDRLLAFLHALGPLPFFATMVFLPAVGAPLAPFYLLAPAHGTALGLVGSWIAVTLNLALSWLLCARLLRGVARRVAAWFGYTIPALGEKDQGRVALLVRIIPGTPYAGQNLVLGLAGVGLGPFMRMSLLIHIPLAAGCVLVGEGLLRGEAGRALVGLMLLVAVMVGVRLLRDRLRRRREGAERPPETVDTPPPEPSREP